MLSFSGKLLETVVFHKRTGILESNIAATLGLINSLGKPTEVNPERSTAKGKQRWNGFLWRDGAASQVIDFLEAYLTYPESYKVKSNLIAEFIRSMNDAGELSKWTIALIGGGDGGDFSLTKDIAVNMLIRKNNGRFDDRYSIG
ncbi:hypothetical protein [Methylomicrobium agile]|uniref:hypothetical protein n=1 Tax=Methylomicrobium agile TaxID=39774 RepID=UPI00068CAFAE|nr:hypothetical protein [Methylomicrobium agile]